MTVGLTRMAAFSTFVWQVTADSSRSTTAQNIIYGTLPSYMGRSCESSLHARMSLLYISPCKLIFVDGFFGSPLKSQPIRFRLVNDFKISLPIIKIIILL